MLERRDRWTEACRAIFVAEEPSCDFIDFWLTSEKVDTVRHPTMTKRRLKIMKYGRLFNIQRRVSWDHERRDWRRLRERSSSSSLCLKESFERTKESDEGDGHGFVPEGQEAKVVMMVITTRSTLQP